MIFGTVGHCNVCTLQGGDGQYGLDLRLVYIISRIVYSMDQTTEKAIPRIEYPSCSMSIYDKIELHPQLAVE